MAQIRMDNDTGSEVMSMMSTIAYAAQDVSDLINELRERIVDLEAEVEQLKEDATDGDE